MPAKAHYRAAAALGHTNILLLSEVTGALHPDGFKFLRALADVHDRKLPTELVGQSWTATSFVTYFLQRLSSAVNMAAAAELRCQIANGPRIAPPPRGGARFRSVARA